VAWSIPEGVRWIEVDDDLVIFNPAVNRFAELDRSGAELWGVLAATDGDESAVVEHLVTQRHLEEPDAASIVAGFVSDLHDNQMLNRRDF
jgi:hypothetical protein